MARNGRRKRIRDKSGRGDRGSALTESLVSLILLGLIFFGLLQIFRWSATKMVMEYASFYVASSHSLGYTPAFTSRVGQVAATGASGRDRSSPRFMTEISTAEVEERFSNYLSNPATSGLLFEYWGASDCREGTPRLFVRSESRNGAAVGEIGLDRMDLLQPGLQFLLEGSVAREGQLSGESVFYDYSQHYIEDR